MSLLKDITESPEIPKKEVYADINPPALNLKNAFSMIREFNVQKALKTSDGSDAGKSDVVDRAAAASDVGFNLMRNTINSSGSVTGSDVADYIERAEELNDEVDTVPFGLETDDGKIVKVYVNAEQADKFEEAMKQMLGLEDDIEEAINRLTTDFDIVDVVWPKNDDEDGDGVPDEDADLEIDDTSNLEDPEDDADFADDQYDVIAGGETDDPAPEADPSTGKVKSAAEPKDDAEEEEPTEDEPAADDEEPADGEEDPDAEADPDADAEEDEETDPDDPDKPKKKKKKKKAAEPAEPAVAAESFLRSGKPLAEAKDEREDSEADSPSTAAAIKAMTSKGLHISAMIEAPGNVVYIEDSQGEEYVMRADKTLTKEKHGKKLMSLKKEDLNTQEKAMTLGNRFLERVLGEDNLDEAKITQAKVKAAHDRADRAELAVEREQGKSGLGRSNEKVRELKNKAQKLRSDAKDLEREMKSQVNEAAGAEDRDGVKDGFNIPLDSQARAMAAKQKLPWAKRLVAFHFMCGVPGRYMNTAEVAEAVASAADMLRKKVAVRRAFSTLYEGLSAAKGFNIPQEGGEQAVKEAKNPVDPDKLSKAKDAVKLAKKALADHNKTYDGGTGSRAKTLQAAIDTAMGKLAKLNEEAEQITEAKAKRGSFIQKLLESVLIELGLPEALVVTTGPAAVGTGIYKTAELIEQDSTLERALRLLATRMGIKGQDAQAPIQEAKKPKLPKDKEAAIEVRGVKGMKSTPFSKKFKNQAAMETWMDKNGEDITVHAYSTDRVNESDARFSQLSALSAAKVEEAVDVGNDDYAQAVTALVDALGIPADILERRRTQVVQALRKKKASLRNRAQILTMIGRLMDIIAKGTAEDANAGGDPAAPAQR